MRTRTPPDIHAILTALRDHRVQYVLVGSVAIQAWGVETGTPGDLDIVPECSHSNLTRLLGLLDAISAESWPVTGRWFVDGRGEMEWENLAAADPAYMSRLPPPDPDDVDSFDSMYSSVHGDFDVVPRLAGTYDDLVRRAVPLTVSGVPGVLVCSIEDLLARLTVPRRTKDASRVEALRAVQRARGERQDVQNPYTRN